MMRAISVRHPWAWWILHGKPVENRPIAWPLGEYALHASKLPENPSEYVYEQICSEMRLANDVAQLSGAERRRVPYDDLRAMSGAIIGVLRVVECVTEHPSPWFFGPVGLVLADVRAIARPIPCKGALWAWRVPPEVELQVREQLR